MNATAQLCRRQIAARTGGGHGFAETTASYYDSSLRQTVTGLPDGTYATNVYFPTSQVKLNYGSRAYPTGTGFDAQNRMIKMTNWNSFAGGMVAGVTTWNYDANRGWLSSKVYDDGHGTAYTHTDAGRLNSRQWARGTNTSYHYNASGDLLSVVYNDNLTPAVFTGYDRRGRKTAAALVTNGFDEVQSATLAYNDAGNLLMESNSVGPLTGVAVVYSYDSYLRRTGVTVTTNGVAVAATGYGYDAASRLVLVSNGTFSATYSYLANSPLVGQIQFKSNTFTAVTTTKNYDALNRLTSIVSTPTGGSTQMPISYAYQYNAANQRTRCTLYDNSYWLYGYDSLGQVTSGKKYWQDGTPVPGEQFGNAFDDIGNRTATTQGGDSHGGSLRTASYSVNDLNQYTSRTVPNAFDVLGQANVAATVKVNGSTAGYRRGEFYQSLFTATNSSAPVWVMVTNTATNGGSFSNVIGNWFIPKTPETFLYDADGNLTNDGRFNCTWDAENRLLTVSNTASIGISGQYLVLFTNDYMGRRIEKVVYTNSGSSWVASYTNKFVYDGWNVVAVLDGGNNLLQSFMWGTDLSGTIQGAGGVGGLLSMTIPSGQADPGTYFYCMDGNGNVGGVVNARDGTVAANYEYGPFGEVIRATGPMAQINPFLFQTEYCDWETGKYYWKNRYYDPTPGRWLSRDPVEESGGANLYAFVGNAPTVFVDAFGLRPLTAAEQSAIAKLRALQTAIAANASDKEVAAKIGDFIADFTAKVAAIPDNQKDPANVAIASTGIVIWDGDNGKFNRFPGSEKDTPVNGLTTLKKDVKITCNYFVADVLQRATGENLGKRSWSGNVWPPVANDYSDPKKDARLKNFSTVETGQMGDVISFPVPGDAGHVGIYLGYGIYVSARTGDVPGTMGPNPIQPFSGVQIKEVPVEERHVIIRHK